MLDSINEISVGKIKEKYPKSKPGVGKTRAPLAASASTRQYASLYRLKRMCVALLGCLLSRSSISIAYISCNLLCCGMFNYLSLHVQNQGAICFHECSGSVVAAVSGIVVHYPVQEDRDHYDPCTRAGAVGRDGDKQ